MDQHFADDPEMENVLLDSSVVGSIPVLRAPQKKTVAKLPQALDTAEAGLAPKSMPM